MRVNFDLDAYRAMFTGGARSYLFFIPLMFPTKPNTGNKKEDRISSFLSKAEANVKSGIDKIGLDGSSYLTAAKNTLSTFGVGRQVEMYPYLVKSTSLPETSFEEVPIRYGGLTYKMAAEKTYSDWVVTLNIDDKGEVLQKFHEWQDMIYNKATSDSGKPFYYMQNQEIHLLDYTGNTTKIYKLYYCWPKSISDTALDYSANEIATFNVTFAYSYFEVLPSEDTMYATLAKKLYTKIGGMF